MATYNLPPVGPGWNLQAIVARYRFSLSLGREVTRLLESAYAEIAKQLLGMEVLRRTDRSAMEARFLEVKALLTEAYGEAQAKTSPILRQYAALEREISARQLQAFAALQSAAAGPAGAVGGAVELATTIGATPGGASLVANALPRQLVVSAARLDDVVAGIDVGGIGWGEWWAKARDDGILRVRRTIQMGVVRGQHPTEIARAIYNTGRTAETMAWRQSRTVAETAARTVVGALQTDAQLAAEAQFPQLIRGYVFRAVLDARTSSICRALADTKWDAKDPRLPRPPLHPNCRSHLEPLVDVPGIETSASHQPTYEQWLKTQPPTVQNAVLGRGIAAHWRGGQVSLADLITADRRPMSLAQVRATLAEGSPASYVGWLQSLPATTLRTVLGPRLAADVATGRASIADVLSVAADRGVITRRD